MQFDVISIFPEVFPAYMEASILGRAQKSTRMRYKVHDLRDYTHDRHRTVDDKPFSGGPGMLMKPQPFLEALADLGVRKKKDGKPTVKAKNTRVIVTAANGKQFTHHDAVRLSKQDRLIFLCGRYEGIDQRVIDRLADETFTIGPYVLTGGELPAMVMMDAIARHVPGVLGDEASLDEESWADGDGLLADSYWPLASKKAAKNQKLKAKSQYGTGEYPQYTRPEEWLGMKVPPVLLSGDPKKIKAWREEHRKKDD
ncbi:tRNA (guanosine(37)-N1)-methyltransferase TrmD [Candidatus Uhrbacteria bacterium]|nr:tRNA (guanosine(37)-N1)-methyltransferase TrmD [Candidatus Uhrbacteria bacterium]MBD3284572.1 tRNA (guanosine(37)-N1)-methyltransferase TrmD [Candidatus Uhrbacteria bacterium]